MGIPCACNTAPIASKLLSLVEFVVHLLQWRVAVGMCGQVIADAVRGVLRQLVDVLPRAALVFEAMPGRQQLDLVIFSYAPSQKITESELAEVVLGRADEAGGRGKLFASESVGTGPVNGLGGDRVRVPEKPHTKVARLSLRDVDDFAWALPAQAGLVDTHWVK